MIETIIMCVMLIALIFVIIILIISKITCPYNLFTHLPLCTWYWFLDWLFAVFWIFIWLLSFLFLYLPIWIIFGVICFIYIPFCMDVQMDDLCVRKKDFFLAVDTIYQVMMEERFLYRNGDDEKNCYCADPLIKLFDPLLEEYKFSDLSDGSDGSNSHALIIAIIILSILYYCKSSK